MQRVISLRSTFNNGHRVIQEASPAISSHGASQVETRIGSGSPEVPIRLHMNFPTRRCLDISSKSCSGRSIFGPRDAYRETSPSNPSWTKSPLTSAQIRSNFDVTILRYNNVAVVLRRGAKNRMAGKAVTPIECRQVGCEQSRNLLQKARPKETCDDRCENRS